jgi:hypothetical protein
VPPAPHGSMYRENSLWGAPMDVVTSSSNERSAAISGRVKVSLWLKLNPIWWFFNDAEQNLAVLDDIRQAQERGEKAHVLTLLHVLHHFLKSHPEVCPVQHPWSKA